MTTGEEGQLLRDADPLAYHTYDEYWHMRAEGYYELIRGWLVKMSAPRTAHQLICLELADRLKTYARRDTGCFTFIAPFDVRLFPGAAPEQDTVVQPDVCLVCDRGKLDERGCNGAPDLIFEVISKKTAQYDRTVKVALYEAAGVREYVVIDAELKRAEQRVLGASGRYPLPTIVGVGETYRSDVVEGFRFAVEEVLTAGEF